MLVSVGLSLFSSL